jgi:hypothetical protein
MTAALVSYYPGVVLVLGGWWYWNAGYWPDRIIADVQLALEQ